MSTRTIIPIDFSGLKIKIEESGMKSSYFSKKLEISNTNLSSLVNNKALSYPSTDFIAKLCKEFECQPADLLAFTNENKYEKRIENADWALVRGEPDYTPLQEFVIGKYENIQYFFDTVKKTTKIPGTNAETTKELLEKRGFEPGSSSRIRIHTTGLSSPLRAKINRNESVSLRVIYEICCALNCDISNVMRVR